MLQDVEGKPQINPTRVKKSYSGCDEPESKPPKPKHGGFGSCRTGRCGTNKKWNYEQVTLE